MDDSLLELVGEGPSIQVFGPRNLDMESRDPIDVNALPTETNEDEVEECEESLDMLLQKVMSITF